MYKKLLNNLLNVRGIDPSLFTKVNNLSAFDLYTKFGYKTANKIVKQKSFKKVRLTEKDLLTLKEKTEFENNPDKIIQIYASHKEKLSQASIKNLNNPDKLFFEKDKLLERLETKIDKNITRWKSYIHKIVDKHTQTNIWPLRIATAFTTVVLNDKTIYAPILSKEVILKLDRSTDKLSLTSEDDWIVNEKLIFMLNSNNIYVNNNINLSGMNIVEALNIVNEKFKTDFSVEKIVLPFENKSKANITNKNLISHPGVVLGMFNPSGGNSRKTMVEIIENDEMDEIIDPEIDKSIYENSINSFITRGNEPLFKIHRTNYSQDKATISSLKHDTIIWGPPGTGKTQTITNIITNILYRDKSAVIMSQKKAALDVLRDRMGVLAKFTLFLVQDNKMSKIDFYKKLQEFVNIVENGANEISVHHKSVIKQIEMNSLDVIKDLKKSNEYQHIANFLNHADSQFDDSNDVTIFNKLNLLSEDLKLPAFNENKKQFVKDVALLNNIEKKGLIFKTYPRYLKKQHDILGTLIRLGFTRNLEPSIKELSQTTPGHVVDLIEASKNLESDFNFKSDEKQMEYHLATRVFGKVNSWRMNNKTLYKKYKSFANAVRAARALPHKFLFKHQDVINNLFDVIIATPNTSFINWNKGEFDYAIIDEASQMFIEVGLPILYISKIHILAGDTQQMKPSSWFTTRDINVDEEEDDIAENAESLLDYGSEKGMYSVMLDKNYRSSSAALMSFSSKEFYESKLDAIDKSGNISESIEVININGKWEKSVNIEEAKKVIEIANENIDKYEKIIILTFNIKQLQLVLDMIIADNQKLFEATWSEKLMVRNIENIQGDEADLVIASIVYDPTTSLGGTYISRSGGRNALNVAISRAKEKFIVVKSLSGNDITTAKSPDSITFKNWLTFLDLSIDEKKNYTMSDEANNFAPVHVMGDTESGFEEEVLEKIKSDIRLRNELDIITQFEIGTLRLDIAFVNRHTKKFVLGVEVDGFKYHEGQGYNKYLQDVARQDYLEAKGYEIFRIKEIDWYLNKRKVLKRLELYINKLI